MKRPNAWTRAFFAASAFCLVSAQLLHAQTAAAPAATAESQAEDEPIVLSPFVVNAAEDSDGYQAKSTLAGTRVRTNLRDISSAISIVTPRFLQDTAVKNSQDLLVYTTNTEVAGLRGNFSGQAGSTQYAESLTVPSNTTRVRGLDAADNTRDYFLTDIPWDAFNVGRVDLQRGPNSILFGVGSPAGIINNSVNDAMLKNAYRFENVVSSYSSMRNSIDVNQVLIEKQLAIRVAGVHDHQKYQQEPAYNKNTRIYTALRWEPQLFNEESHTSLRVKFEQGEVDSNNPRTIPPNDQITPWFDRLNKATLNQLVFGPETTPAEATRGNGSNYAGRLFNSSSQTGGYKQGRTYWGAPLHYYNGANSDQTIPSTRSALPTLVQTGLVNQGWGLTSAGVVSTNSVISDLPANGPVAIAPYSTYAANNAAIAGGSYYADRVLTDPSIFDFYNHLLDGENKHESQNWNAVNAALSQTFFNDRLGFEAVLDHQDYSNRSKNMLGGNYGIGVDVNETLTDGSHNPNVGRPYVASGTGGNRSTYNRSIRDSMRFTGMGELQAEDFLAKSWLTSVLGKHRFTGLWSRDQRRTRADNYVEYATTADWTAWNNLPTGDLTTNRQFDWIYYLGAGLWDRSSASDANLQRMTNVVKPASTGVVRAFDSHWNAPASVRPGDPYQYTERNTTGVVNTSGTQSQNPANYVGWVNVPLTWLSASNAEDYPDLVVQSNKARFKDTSRGFIWQGFMLDDTLVPTFGWRKDVIVNYATTSPVNANTGAAALDYDDDPTTRRDTVGESKSWGGVYHIPKSLMAKIPGGFGLSLFYNRGSNFKADAPRTNIQGDTIANPSAQTKEYGVTVTALDEKLSLKMAWYRTAVKDATFNPTAGNSLAGLGGNGYWMWAAPSWGLFYASAVEATLDNLPGAHAGNYAGNDGVAGANDPASAAFQNATQTALSRQIVDAWLHIPVPDDFFSYYGMHPVTYNVGAANGKIRNMMPGWTVDTVDSTGSQQPGALSPVSTVDTVSKGTELELQAQPTKNWNITLNYSRTFATKQNIDYATVEFMENLHTFFNGPGGQLRLWGQGGSPIGPQWVQNVWNPYEVQVRSAGQSQPEISPWRVNAVTTYGFDQGRLKGIFVGGGVRVEASKILGYTYDATIGTLDISNPLKGSNETYFDFWCGYTRKLKHNLNWRIQLNVRDVGEKSHLVAARYQPDGSLALARIQSGMTWSLTNAIDF